MDWLKGCLLCLAFLGVSSCLPEVETPCDDVDCGGHGECEIITEGGESYPWCACEEGYMVSPDGLTCYRPGGSGSNPPGGGEDS